MVFGGNDTDRYDAFLIFFMNNNLLTRKQTKLSYMKSIKERQPLKASKRIEEKKAGT